MSDIAQIQLEAWQKAFGTTQLTHALARLDAAEKRVQILETETKELEKKLNKCERRRARDQRLANLRND